MMRHMATVDFEQVLQKLGDGVAIINTKDWTIVFINDTAKSLLGITSNVTGVLSATRVLERDICQQVGQLSATESSLTVYQNQSSTGSLLQLTLTYLNASQSMVIIKDHTRVQQLEQIRTDFVGNVSHELRTPLTVILGYLENFSMADDIKPAWRRGLKLMQEQAVRMNELINDLLMLSRLESDETKPMMAVNMPRLLMQVFDQAQASNQAGHLIDVHLDTDRNILGIEAYLYSAISNLVLNAIKYTPAGGEIDIIYEEVGAEVHLSVTDNGIGISGEHVDRLTERFYRVDSGRSRATGGTGLGLAIVKHVLNKHNARLEVVSKEGQGSTFRIIFPNSHIISTLTQAI